jgi:putative CocE/NonD family hydrolase
LQTIPAEQEPLRHRRDILIYQSEPLREALEVTGYPEVELFAASSAPDTDFFVRLIDVASDGRAIDVASGMVRARYRESLMHRPCCRVRRTATRRIGFRSQRAAPSRPPGRRCSVACP